MEHREPLFITFRTKREDEVRKEGGVNPPGTCRSRNKGEDGGGEKSETVKRRKSKEDRTYRRRRGGGVKTTSRVKIRVSPKVPGNCWEVQILTHEKRKKGRAA